MEAPDELTDAHEAHGDIESAALARDLTGRTIVWRFGHAVDNTSEEILAFDPPLYDNDGMPVDVD